MGASRLNDQDQQELLGIARAAIRSELDRATYRPPEPDSPELLVEAGAFVTLKIGGSLRGCIGSLEGTRPLYLTVAEMARSAAFHDPRFPALEEREWDGVRLEISTLTPLEEIDDPESVSVGRHGLVVSRGGHRGVLLPQVPTQFGWDREEFLERTCEKAGMPTDAWRHGARIQVFEAQVFGEEE